MKVKDIKPGEWIVAAVPLLMALAGIVVVAMGNNAPGPASGLYFTFVTNWLYKAVALWALWCMYRMARWQERKSTVFLVLFIIVLLNGLYTSLQHYCPIDHKVNVVTMGLFGLLMFVVGTLAAVRLFHDKVKPMGLVMVLWIIVPLAINLLIPIAARGNMPMAHAISWMFSALLVSLMFLFRNAPGEMADDE